MSIKETFQGLLSSPVVQGLGAAAATGFNPLVGLLAAPAIKSSRDRRRMENEAALRQLEARKELSGLLSGRVTTPGGVPSDRRIRIEDIDGQGGLLFDPGQPGQVPLIGTPAGQMRMEGLLAEIAPEILAQGVFSQGAAGRNPTAMEQKLGVFSAVFPDGQIPENPNATQQGFLQLLGMAPTPTDPNLAMLAQLNAQKAQEEMNASRLATQDQLIDTAAALESGGRRIENIIESVGKLSGSFLQTGVPGGQVRRDALSIATWAADFASGRTPRTNETVTAYDKFQKEVANLLLDTGATLAQSGMGTITDSKMEQMRKSMANENITDQAIFSIMGEMAQDFLTEERKLRHREGYENFTIPNRDFLQALADQSLQFQQSGSMPNPFAPQPQAQPQPNPFAQPQAQPQQSLPFDPNNVEMVGN